MDKLEKNLKDLCRLKGLTLTDVANRMGVNPSNLLSSIKGNPKLSTLQDIANALQISISELLTRRPEKAQGIAIIDGQTYQLSRPSTSTVQLPFYDRYDTLREQIKSFVKKSIEGGQNNSIMGMLESFEVFSLIYDAHDPCFLLSMCYTDGKTLTFAYHELEYGGWKKEGAEDKLEWDIPYMLEDIINDIEGAVPTKLNEQ